MKTPDINCKTPEEIKADAATCLTRPQKSECHRFALYKECAGDCRYVIKELYDLVLYYESRLAQTEREKDAAVHDMENYAGYGAICKHFDNDCPHIVEGCPLWPSDCESYEWRGIRPENTKEEKA